MDIRKIRGTRQSQRGMVTAIVVLLLVATVLVALTQMLNQNTSNQVQVQHHGQSDKAFFIAESGLEATRQRLAILLGARFTNLTCSGITGTSGTLGDGSYRVTAAYASTTAPACTGGPGATCVCDSTSATPCSDCAVTVTGTVGNRSRTITYGVNLSATNGTECNADARNCTNANPTLDWKLNLANTYTTNSVAVFSLAARRQGSFSTANCANGVPCNLQWLVQASPGNSSLSSMGNAVVLGRDGTATSNYTIYQQLVGGNFSIAEVGALFNGTSGASLAGKTVTAAGITTPVEGTASYWSSPPGGAGGTVGKAGTVDGSTTNGSAFAPLDPPSSNVNSGTCVTPTTADSQLCQNWCYDGDTLVYGFAAEASTGGESLDSVNGVVFDYGGQSLRMTRVARYSTNNTTSPNNNTYSEIWYLANPGYLSPVASANTGATFTASAGTTFTATQANNSTDITVTNVVGPALAASQVVGCLSPGNCPGMFGSTITIDRQLSGNPVGTVGGAGTYRLSAQCSNGGGVNCTNSRTLGVANTRLTVNSIGPNQTLGVNDVITAIGITSGTTITAVPGGGSSSNVAPGAYTISAPHLVLSSANNMSVTSTNVRVTGGTTPIAAGTLLAVRSGTGVLQPVTRVAASPAPTPTSFWLDKMPTTQLSGAELCGGTCAFFRQGITSPPTTTPFRITKSAGTGYWSSGFTCLKGVNVAPEVVNSATTTNKRWTEIVTN